LTLPRAISIVLLVLLIPNTLATRAITYTNYNITVAYISNN